MEIDTLNPELDTGRTCSYAAAGPLRQVSIGMSPSVVGGEAQTRALASKLSLPHQGFVLSRPRLTRRVAALAEGGVVSIVAGPGYGKTAFMVDLLSSLDARAVYYAVDDADTDPLRFVSCLMAGFELASGGGTVMGPAVWESPVAGTAAALDLTAKLVESMSLSSERPRILALDDLHRIDSSPAITQVLQVLMRSLPPRWILLLSSRNRPPVDVDDVQLGGRLLRLHGRDLRLTPREVAAWARQNWGVVLEPSEARSLWRITEGWPAALVLLGQHLLSRQKRIEHKDVIDVMRRGRELRMYLENYVIADLEPLAAQVVLAASLLPRVIFPRDDGFLPGEAGAAESLLEDFVSRGFLVTATGRRNYTLHPLLRGFAERELVAREDDTGLLQRAAAHLERNGEYRESTYLYLRAGCLQDAVRPLRILAVSSLNAGISFAESGWLDLIPEPALQNEPWLLVAKAKALQQQTEYAEAVALYERAAGLLSQARDKEGLLSVLLASAFCLFHQGLWEESLAVLARCRSLAESVNEKIEVLVVEGNVLVSLCRWDEAAENWERALALAPPSTRAILAPRVNIHRARLFYSMGHYAVGRQWARKSLNDGADRRSPTYASALNGCAILECVTGEYDAALRHATEALRLAQARGYAFIEMPALLTRAALIVAAGDYRTGLTDIREVQRRANKAGDVEESFWAEDMVGDLCRRQRSPRRALEHHRRALEIAEHNQLSLFERVRAATAMGLDLVAIGEDAEGRAALEEAVRTCRRWRLDGSLVPALLYLGWLDARAGREQEAARSLTEAMRVAGEHEHVDFLVQEAQIAVPILALCDRFGAGSFVRARVLPILSVRLRKYFENLADGALYPTDVSLGPPHSARLAPLSLELASDSEMESEAWRGMENLTDREREVLKMISLGMPNKVIGAKLFITEKTVKTHANHVFQKLGVSSRVQATLAFQSYQRAKRHVSSAGTRRKRR